MIYLWLIIIAITCYFIGSVNFARILAWKRRNQDITTKGSHNPGTMNMLRVYGLKIAVATMILEFLKGGIPALISGLIIEHFFPGMYFVAFFVAGLSAVIGQIFPAIYKFKGGKGLATCAGVFFFTPLWWVGIIMFIIACLILYFTDIASVATLSFVAGMGIAMTIYLTAFTEVSLFWCYNFVNTSPYFWIAVILLWAMICMVFIAHRKNIGRLIKGNENKANFRKSIKREREEVIQEKKESAVIEKEIVIEEEKSNN